MYSPKHAVPVTRTINIMVVNLNSKELLMRMNRDIFELKNALLPSFLPISKEHCKIILAHSVAYRNRGKARSRDLCFMQS